MNFRACALALLAAVISHPALAQEDGPRQTLGWGRLFDNDALGDLHDRWQSGSYTVSLLRGTEWTGRLPETFGALLEFRTTGSTMTTANLSSPDPDDRRYVAPLSIGVHSHFALGGMEASLGGDLVAVGPQTGVGNVQSWLHGVLGVEKPDLTNQLPNAFYPTIKAELGRTYAMAGGVEMRPFIAAEAGAETLVRAGGDVIIGSFGQGALMLRDTTTGQRFRGIKGDAVTGLSFTLGGDVAEVFDSAYLPEGGVEATETRGRLRAGLAWQGERASAFYGVTYLSPEFDGQPEGQLVGSVNLNLRF